MPIKLRGRSKYKNSEDSSHNDVSNNSDSPKTSQKSRALRWRLFPFSRRSVNNSSPASQPGDISSCAFESAISISPNLSNVENDIPNASSNTTSEILCEWPLGVGTDEYRTPISGFSDKHINERGTSSIPIGFKLMSFNQLDVIKNAES
ncbi:hypothetical protein ACTXT7_014792 [Hymenolepis weldensis]